MLWNVKQSFRNDFLFNCFIKYFPSVMVNTKMQNVELMLIGALTLISQSGFNFFKHLLAELTCMNKACNIKMMLGKKKDSRGKFQLGKRCFWSRVECALLTRFAMM